MDEQIINTMRRWLPYPGENLSDEEIERRGEQVQRRLLEQASGERYAIIEYLEDEKDKARGSRKKVIEELLRRIRNGFRD